MECHAFIVGLDLNKTQASRSSHVLLTAAVSSSVVAFLVISVLTLATGVLCGHYFVRRRRKQSSSSNQPTEPLYEDVPTAVEHQEQGLELMENVAYGSAKPMTH
jgi:membrane protein implicated in regulation of membrane protease activity